MREIKFRAWHRGVNEMIYSIVASHPLRWLEDGQPVDLMEYTGLKDKHGDDIYEGDVLQPEAYLKSKFGRGDIIFSGGMFRFAVGTALHQKIAPLQESLNRGAAANNQYVKIGNIHENPNLLQEQDNT